MDAKVIWIGIRPERKGTVQYKDSVYADRQDGLSGDHDTKPHRQITLISQEALAITAEKLGIPVVDPAKTRRNILISGLDFNLPEGTRLQIGQALVEITGPCLPCNRMEENLGEGGRDAMADAGGLTARIIESGLIAFGDSVQLAPVTQNRLSDSVTHL